MSAILGIQYWPKLQKKKILACWFHIAELANGVARQWRKLIEFCVASLARGRGPDANI